MTAADTLHVAIANPDLAPYGVAAREALTALGQHDRALEVLERARGYVEQNPDPSHLNRLNWLRARATLAEARGEMELAASLRGTLPGAAK